MIPFNIDLLTLTTNDISIMKPVTSGDIFVSSSRNFHPEGLFSTEIFGRVSEERRMRTFSYIDLKVNVIHPTIYTALMELKSFYVDVIRGNKYVLWNDKINDFELSDPVNGETGYNYFFSHFKDIKFVENDSDSRSFTIKLIEKFKDKAVLNKLIVIPAGLRDYTLDTEGKPSYDEINGFYRKLISNAGIINATLFNMDPSSIDKIRFNIQHTVNDIYFYLRGLIEGKHKFVQSKWLSRKTYNGTRNVISTLPMDIKKLGSNDSPNYNQTLISLYQYLKATLPLSIHDIRSSILSKAIVSSNEPALLINKKTLRQEEIVLDSNLYDRYLTDDGLEEVINKFGIDELRAEPVVIQDHYLALVYNDGKKVKWFSDIDELPKGFKKEFVSPITYVEWLYMAVYKSSLEVPAAITRYPVSTLGSTYVSYLYLKTTIKYQSLHLLDDDWETVLETLPQFPIKDSSYFNTFAPHPARLARLGADFDGDQLDLVALYTEESRNEIKNLLNSKGFYVNQNNEITSTPNYDTVSYVIASLTGG